MSTKRHHVKRRLAGRWVKQTARVKKEKKRTLVGRNLVIEAKKKKKKKNQKRGREGGGGGKGGELKVHRPGKVSDRSNVDN